MNRRKFIGTAAATALSGAAKSNQSITTDYRILDEARAKPVLKRHLFPDPVIIDSIELLWDRNNFLCRVRSKDGAEGLSIGHPFISKQNYPMFNNMLSERFLGEDARDLDQLILFFLKLWELEVFGLLLAAGKITEEVIRSMQCWKHSGFSVDQSVSLEAGDRKAIR